MHALRATILGRHRIAKGDACARASLRAAALVELAHERVLHVVGHRSLLVVVERVVEDREDALGARCSVYSDVRIFQDLQRFCAAVAAWAPSLDVPGFPDFRPDLQREPPGCRIRTYSTPKPEFDKALSEPELGVPGE